MENLKTIAKEELLKVDTELSNLLINEDGELFRELEEFLKSPKKRIRSLVTILYLKAQGASITGEILNILIAGELIHNASLLHDDVIDNASQRRGKETIGAKFSSKISILAGDFLVAKGIEALLKIQKPEILNTFLECTEKMSKAEINQFFLRGEKLSIEEYIGIAEGKTASLFEAIFESSSIVSGLNIEASKRFAKNFGILFQLKNDLESSSAQNDALNNIFTPKDFLGIEKTNILIDNYLEEIRRDINEFPDNIYKTGLEDLLNKL